MKIILYLAITINGLIAKKNGDVSFISKKSWKNFISLVQKTGNVVIGSKTYKIMLKNGDFNYFKNAIAVVVSRKNIKITNPNHFIANSPKQAVDILRKKGFKNILVGGGGGVSASFVSEKLINDICVDIEPTALGKGINLFEGRDFDLKLKLVDVKKISADEIQLHYQLKK